MTSMKTRKKCTCTTNSFLEILVINLFTTFRFLILDLYEGGDLYNLLITNGALRPSEALHLFRQLIDGTRVSENFQSEFF